MNIKFDYKTQSLEKVKSDCLVFFISQTNNDVSLLPKTMQRPITQAMDLNDTSGKSDKIQLLYTPSSILPRILLVGLGESSTITHEKLRRIAGKVGKKVVEMKITNIALVPPLFLKKSLKTAIGTTLTEGIALGAYQFLDYKTQDSDENTEAIVTIYDLDKATNVKAMNLGEVKADATNFARNLGNTPPNDLPPSGLADHAQAIADEHKMDIQVLEEEEMKALGMDMLLGVSQGSVEPAKLICLEYKHKKATQTIALIGKGVTFDSGGISLKPGKDMDEMKFDMCGAAAVLGAMKAIGTLKPKVNVIGVVPTTENLPGGNAQRPGDIVKAYSGKKVEILNTDAEGRLILGDALTYTAKKYSPDAMVDLATLTGACVVALGHYATGAITNDDRLCEKVVAAGNSSGDRVWPLPNFEEYDDQIKGKYADLQNIGGPAGGTITAGLFLKNFVEEVPWVHLDIAGTAWGVKNIGHNPNSGATGVGVRLLIDLVTNW